VVEDLQRRASIARESPATPAASIPTNSTEISLGPLQLWSLSLKSVPTSRQLLALTGQAHQLQ
jgi:hypothetical protein